MSDDEEPDVVTEPARVLSKEEAAMANSVAGAKDVALKTDAAGFAFLSVTVNRRKKEAAAARAAAERVECSAEHVALVAAQLDLDSRTARELLQSHGGDVSQALEAALSAHTARVRH